MQMIHVCFIIQVCRLPSSPPAMPLHLWLTHPSSSQASAPPTLIDAYLRLIKQLTGISFHRPPLAAMQTGKA